MPRKYSQNSKTSATRLNAEAKGARALELRMQGLNFEAIAKRLGYTSKASAYNALKSHLQRYREQNAETVEEYRQVENARLDALTEAVFGAATRGDIDAIKAVLDIMKRRAALLGLDAPAKQELTGADGGPVQFTAPMIWLPPERSDEQSTGLPAAPENDPKPE